jgi:hypothetical protein
MRFRTGPALASVLPELSIRFLQANDVKLPPRTGTSRRGREPIERQGFTLCGERAGFRWQVDKIGR